MKETLLEQINSLRWLVLIYVAATIAACIVISVLGKEFKWRRRKIVQFAFFYTLDRGCKQSLCFTYGRLLFVFYLAAVPSGTGLVHGIVFFVLCLLGLICSGDVKGFFGSLLTCAGLFGLLLLESMFSSYYREVESYWMIRAVVIFLGSFCSLYAIYSTLLTHEKLVRVSGGDALQQSSTADLTPSDSLRMMLSKKRKDKVSIIDE